MADTALFPRPKAAPKRRPVRRGALITIEAGRRSAWLYGEGIWPIIIDAGVPRMADWHPDRHKVATIPVDRVDDVLALIEFRDRRPVELRAVDR